MPPKSAGSGTQRGGLCSLIHMGYGFSPWVSLPSPAKALHGYETMTADKKPWLRERSTVGSYILSQLNPSSFSLMTICGYQIQLKITPGCLWGAEG